MPSGLQELRVAVGDANARRSTVWKFSVNQSDVYIFSRMFGADSKVSLHALGDCQWSNTDKWVTKVPGRRNADRHIQRWNLPRPNGTEALHIFRVWIPESELRQTSVVEDLGAVRWLPAPPAGQMVILECYVTPPSRNDPTFSGNLPYSLLASLPLADGRWFAVLHRFEPCDVRWLEFSRSQMIAQTRAKGYEPKPEHRACLFAVSDGGVRGLIEVCPVAPN
jgi:hypothetical protein